jgi:hypothetical protein
MNFSFFLGTAFMTCELANPSALQSLTLGAAA